MTEPRLPKPAPAVLAGLRIVEFAGIGPGPFAGMMLVDMGADVIVIERTSDVRPGAPRVPLHRNKRSIVLDLKSAAGPGEHAEELLAEVGLAPDFLAH